MESYKMNIDLHSHVDLRNKADHFLSSTLRLQELNQQLLTFVKTEMKDSSGEMVDKINEEIMEQKETNQLIIDEAEIVFIKLANQYMNHINEIRTQSATIHYKLKKIEEA